MQLIEYVLDSALSIFSDSEECQQISLNIIVSITNMLNAQLKVEFVSSSAPL